MINPLRPRQELADYPKKQRYFRSFEKLLEELITADLPSEILQRINAEIDKINAASVKKITRQLYRSQSVILKEVEKSTGLVPRGYYQNLWTALGMATFGLPLGVLLGTLSQNMGLLGLGLPIGLAIGMGIGMMMDKKAQQENRQLHWEIKW